MADRNFWIVEGAILFELTDDDDTQCAVRITSKYVMGGTNSVSGQRVSCSKYLYCIDLLFDPTLLSDF